MNKTYHSPAPWNNGCDANGNLITFQDERVTGGHRNEEYQANRRLTDAAPQLLALVEKAVDILASYLLPDSGISEHEAVNQLLGVFDGPDYRATIAKITGQTVATAA